MCGHEDPLFTPLMQFARVPFQAKVSVHKAPYWENFEILASAASISAQILAFKPPNLEIFSSQALKLGNFQFTGPQIWKFSAHEPPFQRQVSVRNPSLRKSGPHTPTWKKVECPPRLEACAATTCLFLRAIQLTEKKYFEMNRWPKHWQCLRLCKTL